MKRLIAWFHKQIERRRLAREMEITLAARRRGRAKRQAAARKAAETRFQHHMEGLRR